MKKRNIIAFLCALTMILPACTPTDAQTTAGTTGPVTTEKVYADIGTGTFSLEETEIYMTVGETSALVPVFDFDAGDVSYTYSYDDSKLRIENGVMTALAAGDTEVTVRDEKYGKEAAAKVTIVRALCDNIIISVPIWRAKWANEEQFGYMDEAGVDMAVAVSGIETADYKTSELMLDAAKTTWGAGTGVRVLVHSTELLKATGFSDSKIANICNRYSKYTAFAGFHIIDEPFDPSPYGLTEKRFSDALPGYIYDTNFLPGGCYPSYTDYYNRMCDYAQLAGDGRSFISFDNYPFGPSKYSVDENALFGNLNAARKAGLKTDTPTAFYVQAVGGFNNSYRRPDKAQLTYHMGAALAYGYKWIKYWSWFVPDYGTDPENTTYNDYTDAIISKDGLPTADLYPVAKELHSRIHTLGTTLVNLDAVEVYHTGSKSTETSVYDVLPESFFIQPDGENVYSIVSLMEDGNGGDYLMLVNKNIRSAQTLTYTCNVNGIKRVSDKDGSLSVISTANGTLTVTLDAGDFALLKLPDGDYKMNKPVQEANLAAGAQLTSTGSATGDGWFINCLTDDIRVSKPSSMGWKASSGTSVTLFLGEEKSFNRVDLYPAGNKLACGSNFPTGVKIFVSDDGKAFTEIFATELTQPEENTPTFNIGAQSGRYVKLEFSCKIGLLEVGEIELYNDDGSIPAPDKTDYTATVPVSGENLALHKAVFVSGTAYESSVDKWSVNYLTDGSKLNTEADGTNGWMSNGVASRTDETYATVDLAAAFTIDRVVLYPRKNGGFFPIDYNIMVSADAETWITVAEITNDTETDGIARTLDFEAVNARYVKLVSKKLSGSFVDFANGYMMQISEIEVYKK